MNPLLFENLLATLDQAKINVLPPSELYHDLDPDTDEIDIEDLNIIEQNEQFVNGEEKKIEDIVGIPKNMLPPVEELSDEEVDLLVPAMVSLWSVFHFAPVYTDVIPPRLKYTLLREKWDYETTHVTCGTIHIEFCDYQTEHCPFGSNFCSCKEFEKEAMREDNHSADICVDDLLEPYKDIKRVREVFVLNHKRDNYIYQCFAFDNRIKEIFYPGNDFLSPVNSLTIEEKIELTKDLAEKKDAFMPGLVNEIELILGKENSIYDYWEFSDSDFALYWWIHKSVYHEKMKLFKSWVKYKEIEPWVEFTVEDVQTSWIIPTGTEGLMSDK